jgi:hypothetical protein
MKKKIKTVRTAKKENDAEIIPQLLSSHGSEVYTSIFYSHLINHISQTEKYTCKY